MRLDPNASGSARRLLLGTALAAVGGLGWLCFARPEHAVAAAAGLPLDAAPVPGIVPADAPAEAAAPAIAQEVVGESARAGLEAAISELVRELVHEPYQPGVFAERLEGCLAEWTPELRAELERALQAPPASDAEFVALAALGRAQGLPLAPALAARLRPIALREDLAFGLSLESARALVGAGGVSELGWWCTELENARSSRARSIAAGALAALRDGAGERFVLERALELGNAPAAGRLLDALGQALERVDAPAQNPARLAAAARLVDIAGDPRADGSVRARSLGLLRQIDPQAATRLAADWFLDPAAGSERIDFAANCLQGRPEALATLQSALADPRTDDLRRARLAECVLFSDPAELAPAAREVALAQMRSALHESRDGAARRRAVHALARYGSESDRAELTELAQSDADPLARAAARSSLLREASEWR